MTGGPRHGSGRQTSAAARSQQIRIMMTEPEYDDVALLAEQWDVPIATAGYGLFTESLSRIRRVRPQSPENLVVVASRMIAKHDASMIPTKGYSGD